MATPYEKNEGWCIVATKFKGSIYLYEYLTESRRQWEMNRDQKSNMFSYGGIRFEKCITQAIHGDGGDGNEKTRFIVYHHTEYSCVVSTSVGAHVLLYSAEVDCVERKEQAENPNLSDFIEIKTSAASNPNHPMPLKVSPFKMLRWWTQSSLMGTEKIVCGFRDDDMIVREIDFMKVEHLTHMPGKKFWSPNVCHRMLGEFLDFVKDTVTEDDPDVMYEFVWKPGQDVTWIKTVPTEDQFVIPKWYIDAI